jgi:hypothetical protein
LDTGDLSFARLAAQLADGPVDQAHALVVIMSSLPSLYCATTTGSTAWMQRKTPLTRIATGPGDDGVLHLRASSCTDLTNAKNTALKYENLALLADHIAR